VVTRSAGENLTTPDFSLNASIEIERLSGIIS
jgi:hypothetical protein